MSKDSKRTKQYFSEQSLIRFIKDVMINHYHLAFYLMLTSGISPSELVTLKWCDLDRTTAIIKRRGSFKNGKLIEQAYPTDSPKRRIIPLVPEVHIQLRILANNLKPEQIPQEFRSLIFLTKNNKPYHSSDLIRNFNMVFREYDDTPQMCILQNTAKEVYKRILPEFIANYFLGKSYLKHGLMNEDEIEIMKYEADEVSYAWKEMWQRVSDSPYRPRFP